MSDTNDQYPHPPFVVLYAVGIHEALKSGDASRMREVEQAAQQYLAVEQDVRSALQELQAEIDRARGAGS